MLLIIIFEFEVREGWVFEFGIVVISFLYGDNLGMFFLVYILFGYLNGWKEKL